MLRQALLCTTWLASSVLLASTGFTQEAAPADAGGGTVAPAPDADEPQGGLQEIVVTARKRAESVQDVPAVVTAIPEVQIRRADLTSIERIAARTPNFTVGRASNGAGAQLSMRGIGSPSTSIGIEQSVAVVVDGVYYGQGRVINEGFFDLSRVEILKGPQALFFGKNATAGVISLTTADPTATPEFRAKLGYEFRSQQLLGELIGSGPLTDTLGIRVAVRGSKMWGGYYKNVSAPTTYNTFDSATLTVTPHSVSAAEKDGPQERELLGRVTLKWEPDDRWTANLKVSGGRNEVTNGIWNYVMAKCEKGVSTLNPIYKCGRNFINHAQNLPSALVANFPYAREGGELYNVYKSFAATANVAYKADALTITSVTNYQWNNNHYAGSGDFQNSPTGTWVTENTSWRSFSTELRALTTFDGPLNLLAGVLYQKSKRDFGQWIMFGNLENSLAAPADRYAAITKDSNTKGETVSGYAQVIWKVAPTLELTGGVRYTHETKDSYFVQPYINPLITGLFRQQDSADGLGVVNVDQTFDNWSPDATITWKPNDDIVLYGAYKTGFKSGGFSNGGLNSASSADPARDLAFDDETASGFEAGIKTTLAGKQLRFNVTAYSYKYSGLQVDFFNSSIFAFQTLTADARTKGIETEFEFAPYAVPGLNIHGSLNYNDAKYTSFLGPCFEGQRPAEGCLLDSSGHTPAAGQSPTYQLLDGKPLSMAAKWTGAFGVSYDRDVGESYRFGVSADMRYSSSYIVSSFNNPDSRQSPYAVLDASVRFGDRDDRWEIALVGKNLTNKFYGLSSQDGPSTGSGTGTPGGVHADEFLFGNLPRTVQLQASVKF